MVAAASVVVAIGTATGMLSALDDRRDADEARGGVTSSPYLAPLPAVPTPSASPAASGSASPSPKKKASPTPSPTQSEKREERRTAAASTRLYRHPESQVLDWVRAHDGDARHAVIASRIADQPAAVWFADFTPSTITSRVRAVTSGGSAQARVPVVVPYAIPARDCGGASQGGAPDLAAYDGWIDAFAAGLGSGEVIVILEPDSVAQAECLSAVSYTHL